MARLSYASTRNKDQFYAVRINILDDFFFLEIDAKKFIFLDHREIDVFKEKNKNPAIEAIILDVLIGEARKSEDTTDSSNKLALEIIRKYGLEKSDLEVPSYFPLDMADYLRSKGLILTIKKPFCPERELKEEWEAKAIEESLKKTQHAYQRIEEIFRDSLIVDESVVYKNIPLTSEFLKMEVDKVLLEHGMMNIEGSIISSGKDASMPHHPGQGIIKSGETIICDLFPVSMESGYFADMTRTYVKGIPHPKMQKMYDSVLRAQETALKMANPGVKAKDIHEACCKIFLEDGFDVGGQKGFTHATGHGLGLDVHESPNVSKGSEVILRPGHVVTIEPGLYYSEYGGVRIEDVVYITETGSRNLTDYPKNFIIPWIK